MDHEAAESAAGDPLRDQWDSLRYALRSLARTPGFTLAPVLVLGIGIGSVSLIFSTLNTVVLQPLPIAEPGRLVWPWPPTPSGTESSTPGDSA